MLYALICRDKPGKLQKRLDTRAAHLAWLEELNGEGRIKIAGPFLGDDGNPCGTLILVEAEDRDRARTIADADPYAQAGLFENVEIKAFNWVVNNPDAAA